MTTLGATNSGINYGDATHEVFIQPIVEAPSNNLGDWPEAQLGTSNECGFIWHCPPNWQSINSITIVMIPDATETIQVDIDVSVSAAGEAQDNDTRQSLNETLSVTADQLTEWDISGIGTLFASVAVGDYIGIRFQSDTNTLRVLGCRISWEELGA